MARMQGLVHLSKLLGSEPLKQAQDTNTEGKLSDIEACVGIAFILTACLHMLLADFSHIGELCLYMSMVVGSLMP